MRSPHKRVRGGEHRSVLLQEVLDGLEIEPGDIVLDTTLGGGGHAREIAKMLGGNGMLIGFDLDGGAIERARLALADAKCRVEFVRDNFRHLGRVLDRLGIREVTKVLFDLGMSSYQLNLDSGLPAEASAQAGRGFSFLSDESLAMTYSSESEGVTAATIVNDWAEESIADILFGFGQERYARRIAKALVERRARGRFTSARELAEAVASAVPSAYRRGRIHPATRTFQALRIAVNDELGALAEALPAAWQKLRAGGRIAVISFHSIEDRMVKQRFREWEKEGRGRLVNKKPIVPGSEEIAHNPRSRSAKLRVFEKQDFKKTV